MYIEGCRLFKNCIFNICTHIRMYSIKSYQMLSGNVTQDGKTLGLVVKSDF